MFRRTIASTRFLVAGPTAGHRRALGATLIALGARTVREAPSIADAVDQYDYHAPDVVCLDWAGPDFDAGQVVASLWARIGSGRRPQVLVVMDHPTRALVERCRQLGVFAVIRKPYAPRTMGEKIMAALAGPARPVAVSVDARPLAVGARAVGQPLASSSSG